LAPLAGSNQQNGGTMNFHLVKAEPDWSAIEQALAEYLDGHYYMIKHDGMSYKTVDVRRQLPTHKTTQNFRGGRRAQPLTPEQQDRIRALLSQGWKVNAIRDELAIGMRRLQPFLNELRRDDPGVTLKYNTWTDEETDELMRLRRGGLTFREIARYLKTRTEGACSARFKIVTRA
jgi:hypothetical protein